MEDHQRVSALGDGRSRLPGDSRRRVLLIINSPIGPRMSGPGIRYCEFARILSASAFLDVTLSTTPGVAGQPHTDDLPFRLDAAGSEADLGALAVGADVIIAPGAVVGLYPSLQQIHIPLVLDLCTPLLLEELERPRLQSLAEQTLIFNRLRRELLTQVLTADLILCASEKQRDYLLGALSVAGRINPYTHSYDPTLRRLITVVSFGLPSRSPQHTRQVLKGVFPGIDADDKVLLWFGGLYDWFDAPTLIRAMASLANHRPDVKLFIVKHPNPQEDQRRGTQETLSLADELRLTGRTVFFNDWVPYDERASYLLEADVGVSLHRDHLETRFSFRTRFLDYLWAGLPIVATRGDVLGEQVEVQGLGRTVEPGDVEGVATAILDLLNTPNLRQTYRPRFEQAAAAYRWEVVTQPLVEFCAAPRFAPDREHSRRISVLEVGPTRWWQLPGKALRALRAGGVGGAVRQVSQYRRWLLNRRGKG